MPFPAGFRHATLALTQPSRGAGAPAAVTREQPLSRPLRWRRRSGAPSIPGAGCLLPATHTRAS
jgi:hypothetical protein